MTIQENVSLAKHSTMRLGGNARYASEIYNEDDLLEALAWADERWLQVRAIGDGSNIFWQDSGYDGLLLVIKIPGFELLKDHKVRLGAGLNWDKAVAQCVISGLSGVEYLSLIPGTVGATPIQNVGAYGCEISDVLVSVRAYDTQEKSFVILPNSDCAFGYRTSRFKTTDNGRFIICGVTLQLDTALPASPFYESLQTYLDQKGIISFTPQVIRDAVIDIRSSKLPDPAVIANNGSFFANPRVPRDQYAKLQQKFPGLKGWSQNDDMVKISAGWLIEKAGFNDFHDRKTGMATWAKQNLVLINEHAKNTKDLLKFKQKIVGAVHKKFGIELQQEPELLP